MMKRQGIDVVAKAHASGTLDGRGDHEIGAGQEGIVGEVVLGEPALAKAKAFGQGDLVEHLGIGLIVGRAPPPTVVEEPKIHERLLSKIWMLRQREDRHTSRHERRPLT
jgi:hypothetical protein